MLSLPLPNQSSSKDTLNASRRSNLAQSVLAKDATGEHNSQSHRWSELRYKVCPQVWSVLLHSLSLITRTCRPMSSTPSRNFRGDCFIEIGLVFQSTCLARTFVRLVETMTFASDGFVSSPDSVILSTAPSSPPQSSMHLLLSSRPRPHAFSPQLKLIQRYHPWRSRERVCSRPSDPKFLTLGLL